METFIAVKNYLDYSIDFRRAIRALDDGQLELDFQGTFHSILEKFQSSFMQEALLFDKVYLLWPDAPDPLLDLIKDTVEGNGDIFSFIDPDGMILGWDTPRPPSGDEIEALAALLNWGAIAGDKLNEHRKIQAEYARKFPELQDFINKIENPEAKVSSKPRKFKSTPEEKRKWHQELGTTLRKLEKSTIENEYPLYDFLTRLQAWRFEYLENVAATPLLPYTSYQQRLPNSRRHDIAQLVIHDLPLPDSSKTTWQQIIEYRKNPDNRKDLLGLRRWIRKLSTENLSTAECTQELEYLQSEFQTHLRLHEIKTNTATLEVIVKAPLEILENLVTLKFSKLVDPLFAIKKRRIALMEAELSAPGREIAYLIKAQQSFK